MMINKVFCFFFIFSEQTNASLSDTMKVGAFADTTKKNVEPIVMMPNVPFSKLLIEKSTADVIKDDLPSKTICKEDQNGNSPKDTQKMDVFMVSTNDDFIMVDLVNFYMLRCCMNFPLNKN